MNQTKGFILGILIALSPLAAFAIPENPGGTNFDVVGCTGIYSIDTPTFVVDCVNDRVGISTAAPSSALSVAGDASVTGDITFGGSIFGDASGLTGLPSGGDVTSLSLSTAALNLSTISIQGQLFTVGVDTEALTVQLTAVALDTTTHQSAEDDHFDHADNLTELNSQIGSGLVTGSHTTDTSAAISCTGANILEGSGACVANAGSAHGDGFDAASGFLCRGTNADGECTQAPVDATAVSGSTNALQSDALFDHDALEDAHFDHADNLGDLNAQIGGTAIVAGAHTVDNNAETLCADGQFLRGEDLTTCRSSTQIISDGGGPFVPTSGGTFTGTVILSETGTEMNANDTGQMVIRATTTDTNDTQLFNFSAGGAAGIIRGADFLMFGNDHPTMGGAMQFVAGNSSVSEIQFFTGAAVKTLVVTGANRVGIGTATPTSKLGVDGDVSITGSYIGDGSGITNIAIADGSVTTSKLGAGLFDTFSQDTNASTLCTGSNVLEGSGACVTNAGGGGGPIIAIKGSDESDSTQVLQDDDDLALVLATNTSYIITLSITATTSGNAADLKFGFTAPGTWTLDFPYTGYENISDVFGRVTATGDNGDFFNIQGGQEIQMFLRGVVTTTGSAGTLQFQWSMNGAGTSTTVQAKSFIKAEAE